jgi:hypothetical protein
LDIAGSLNRSTLAGYQKDRHGMLHEFLESKRNEIITRTKAKVAARSVPRATEAELTTESSFSKLTTR